MNVYRDLCVISVVLCSLINSGYCADELPVYTRPDNYSVENIINDNRKDYDTSIEYINSINIENLENDEFIRQYCQTLKLYIHSCCQSELHEIFYDKRVGLILNDMQYSEAKYFILLLSMVKPNYRDYIISLQSDDYAYIDSDNFPLNHFVYGDINLIRKGVTTTEESALYWRESFREIYPFPDYAHSNLKFIRRMPAYCFAMCESDDDIGYEYFLSLWDKYSINIYMPEVLIEAIFLFGDNNSSQHNR